MIAFLSYLWQLPQNLVGLFLLLWYRHEEVYRRLNGRTFYFTSEMPSGISLGKYIILNRADLPKMMRHEYGHTIQSMYLGPLYLIVVGLPSILGSIYSRIFNKSNRWYYNLPWEKWADKLGKVKRYD